MTDRTQTISSDHQPHESCCVIEMSASSFSRTCVGNVQGDTPVRVVSAVKESLLNLGLAPKPDEASLVTWQS